MRLCVLVLLFISVLTHADPYVQECVDYKDYQFIAKRISFYLGERDPSLCDPKSRFYRVIEALNLVRQLKFDGPTPPYPYNQEIIGTDFYSRIVRLIPRIEWGPNETDAWGQRIGVSACKGYGAYVRMAGDRKMFWCPGSFKDLTHNSAVYFIVTMLHESRHQEGNSHPHVSCKGGYYCDQDIFRKGAYAVSVEAHAKLGVMSTNLHPTMSYLARRSAYNISQNSFRQVSTPKKLKYEGLAFLTEMNGKRIAFNHRVMTQAFFDLDPGRIINLNQGRVMLAPSSLELPAESHYKFEFQRSEPDSQAFELYQVISHYNDSTTDRRMTFKSARTRYHRILNVSAEIWGDEIEVHRLNTETKAAVLSKVKLPSGKPLVFRDIEGYTDYHSEHRFHVVADNDKLFEIKVPEDWTDIVVEEVPNKYPGFTDVIKLPYLVETQAWDDAEDKWKKNKKNRNIPYPISKPDEKYDTYLLDREGYLHIEEDGKFPLVRSLRDRRFQSLAGGMEHYLQYPAELGPIGD